MIQIENLYFLLCYAWDILPERAPLHVDAQKASNVLNLLASVFLNHLARQVKRGMPHRYVAAEEELHSIRGRLLFSETIRKNRLREGKAVCRFDEFSPDHAINRVLKATLIRLCRADTLAKSLQQRAIQLQKSLPAIEAAAPISSVKLHHLLQHTQVPSERLLLHLAQLLHENLLVNEHHGRFTFQEFWRNEGKMAAVFEAFVRNFYRLEQHQFSVKREHIPWQLEAPEADRLLLPRMITDVSLQAAARKVIIDTKYYAETLQCHFDAQKVHSTHLYQLFAYLKNQPVGVEPVEGILLYPVVDRRVSLRYTQHRQTIRVETLDLAQPWQQIHTRLLEMIQ